MLRIGTLGTALITPRALIYPAMDEPRVRVYAVAAREFARAQRFAQAHHIAHALPGYADVVSHERVDVLYNPLHIPAHHEWTLQALAHGKHVLCEKSMACNAQQAQEMVDAATAADRGLMDAFHYRYHPMFQRCIEIYRSGELGAIEHIDAASCFTVEKVGADGH